MLLLPVCLIFLSQLSLQMQGSKIRLSATEMKLYSNAEVILTKNSILQKTVSLLSEIQCALLDEAVEKKHHFSPLPKISKGENYLGLPYVVLDYPRISKGPDLFFIRSLFWWGNFYSSTLQISGKYKKALENLVSSYATLSAQQYFVGVNDDPWHHHFEVNNYKPVHTISKTAFEELLCTQPHIKIAAHWPLSDWDSAASKLIESWKLLTGLVS